MGAQLVLVHGWGFDGDVWNPLCELLGDMATQVHDLGFFGRPAAALPEPGAPVVAVGHSLGFMWLLHRHPFAWDALVSVCGMPRFTAAVDYPHGVAPRLLERMAARMKREPRATVDDFRRRCGVGAARGELDESRLGEGLDWLRQWDLRGALAAETVPLLALGGEGMVQRMVRELDLGFFAQADDPVAIRSTLEELYALFCRDGLRTRLRPQVLRRYHRRELTRELAQIFDRLVQQ